MAKKRVHEIAKERGLSAKDLVDKLQAAGLEVTAAASSVEESDALRVIGNGGGSSPAPTAAPNAGAAATAPEGRRQPVKPASAKPGSPPEGRRQPVRPGAVPPEGRRQPVRPGAVPPEGRRQPVRPSAGAPTGRGEPVRGTSTPRASEPPRPAPRRPALDDLPVDPRRQMGRTGAGQAAPNAPAARPAAGPAAAPAPAAPSPAPKAAKPAPEAAKPAAPAAKAAPATPAPTPAAAAPTAPAPARPAPAPVRSEARQQGRGPSGPAQRGGSDRSPRPARPAAGRPMDPPRLPTPARRPIPQGPVDPRVQQANRGRPGSPPPMRVPQSPVAPPAAEQTAAGATPATPAKPEEAATPVVGVAPRAGAGPKIISVPEPPKRPKRDETQSQPGARPTRGGQRGESGPGAGKRRVVIDSQAARRGPGAGGPGPGPQQRPPRRRRRRRRTFMEEVAAPLDSDALTRTDLVRINSGSTVKDVAEYLGVPVPDIIKKMMGLGELANLTKTLSDEHIELLAEEFDKRIEIVHVGDEADDEPAFEDEDDDLVERPPVVTIMGHVDHGKTSLLDAMRSAEVAAGEAGGITQHIGAYQVTHNDHEITFLDTPGHEAFTAMRARGARVTDIAVIVVAADDGVKPQTVEAIDHARAAGVPIVVAVNKIDKEGADPVRVRTEMTTQGLQPVEWGGETEYVDVSAKTGEGLDDLLDTLLVVAEVEELVANPDVEASGVVIESKLDPGRGPVVTVLVQRGTLRVADALYAGPEPGKVRAMIDFRGDRVAEALPGDPVEVLGFDGVPAAGERVLVVANDREARRLAQERDTRVKAESLARRSGRKVSFQDVFRRHGEDEVAELAVVVKGDVAGSVEALEDEIARLPQDEVHVNVIHRGVGGITESDVMLAAASDAVIIGFNVRPVGQAREEADREGVEIRNYSVIYKVLDDLRGAMQGLLAPEEVEDTVGMVEIRATFRASRIGTIAGCYVLEGSVKRNARVRVLRDGTIMATTTIDSLKRFNEDVREVQTGFECGIVLANYQDIREGDTLEVFETRQVERELQPS